jgi:hypothetical protein
LFMIQHDCGHGSFLRSRKARDRVGFLDRHPDSDPLRILEEDTRLPPCPFWRPGPERFRGYRHFYRYGVPGPSLAPAGRLSNLPTPAHPLWRRSRLPFCAGPSVSVDHPPDLDQGLADYAG